MNGTPAPPGRAPADSRSDDDVRIVSLVVSVRPAGLTPVRRRLQRLAGVEVYAADPRGKLIVVIEADSDALVLQRIDAINRFDDVVGAGLVYQHQEPRAALQEVIDHDDDAA